MSRGWTIEDIRNPKRKSGFDHVGYHPARGGRKPRYHAQFNGPTGPGLGASYMGPNRDTPEEAAQDAVDYKNGLPATPAPLKTAGHQYETPKVKVPSDIEAARGMIRDWKAQQQGKPGYVYLIIEVLDGGALIYGKIGYSVNPKKRVAELQTGNPRLLKLHAMKRGTERDERALQRKYRELNVLQEWFWLGHARGKELLLEFDLDHNGDPWGAEEAASA